MLVIVTSCGCGWECCMPLRQMGGGEWMQRGCMLVECGRLVARTWAAESQPASELWWQWQGTCTWGAAAVAVGSVAGAKQAPGGQLQYLWWL